MNDSDEDPYGCSDDQECGDPHRLGKYGNNICLLSVFDRQVNVVYAYMNQGPPLSIVATR